MRPGARRLLDLPGETFGPLADSLSLYEPELRATEMGTVVQVANGIARVRGLREVRQNEVLRLGGQIEGMAANLSREEVGVILLGEDHRVRMGDTAKRTHHVVDVGVGERLLGRVVDALGRPLDEKGPVRAAARWPVERPAPAIIDRAPVNLPLQTGIKAVDAALPIGRGQRELILGDRQTGKTAIALDAILNQRAADVVCVYCAIGLRGSAVAKVVSTLRAEAAMANTVVVVAAGEDPPGLQFVAPYAATTVAEYFLERGRDVLIVYDDLTRHARAYRELSLLLRRPPGREAYPGDIFYVHSRLLERSTRLAPHRGGGSLTALPIVETHAQNISAYIPTNLISITDGQIYLSPELFRKGQLPAIDIGKSVSRVGGKAQLPSFRALAGDLRLAYAQFEELETFARFGTRLDPQTRRALERGRRAREVMKQTELRPLSVPSQLSVLLAMTHGLLDDVALERIAEVETALSDGISLIEPALWERLASGAPLDDDTTARLLECARDILGSRAAKA